MKPTNFKRRLSVEEGTGTAGKNVAEEVRAHRRRVAGRPDAAYLPLLRLLILDFLETTATGDCDGFLDKVVEHFMTTPLAKIDQEGSTRARFEPP
jgi:hypothetical protein